MLSLYRQHRSVRGAIYVSSVPVSIGRTCIGCGQMICCFFRVLPCIGCGQMISRVVVVVTTTDDCASEAAGRVRLPFNSGSDSHQLLVPDEIKPRTWNQLVRSTVSKIGGRIKGGLFTSNLSLQPRRSLPSEARPMGDPAAGFPAKVAVRSWHQLGSSASIQQR